jgi:hypothetical protein
MTAWWTRTLYRAASLPDAKPAENAVTRLFVPETGRLYLAAPRQQSKEGREVRVFQAK